MGNVFNSGIINRVLLCSTLVAFPLTSIPAPCYSFTITPNDVVFVCRMERLIEKIYKAVDKNDADKVIDLMFDVKEEIEGYTGQSIDLEEQLHVVKKEIKKQGADIPKKEFKALKHMLKKKEKRHRHRALYMEKCCLAGIPYIAEEEYFHFMAKHGQDEEENEEVYIPIRLTVGVAVALAGVVCVCLPLPPQIKGYGTQMVLYGAGIAAEACYTAYDERNKK